MKNMIHNKPHNISYTKRLNILIINSEEKREYSLIRASFILMLVIIFGSLSVSCSEQSSKKTIETPKSDDDLYESVFLQSWGNTKLSFPDIPNWQDVKLDSINDRMYAELETPTDDLLAVVAPYLSNASVTSESELYPSMYFTISGMKSFKNREVNHSVLAQIQKEQEFYIDTTGEEIAAGLNMMNNDLRFDKPVLIEKYSLNKNSNQLITLSKNSGSELITLGILNNFIVKSRLLQMGFYMEYEDENSIKDAKALNDYIMEQILEANNN